MKFSTMFPSSFIKCADLDGKPKVLTIASVKVEQIARDGSEPAKPVIKFKEIDQALVLNKTNGAVIADALGDDTDRWIGQKIALKPSRTTYQGKLVDCIRVACRRAEPPPVAPDESDPEYLGEPVDDDEIPF